MMQQQEIKSALFNKRTLLGMLIMLVCLFGVSIPEWLLSYNWGAEYRQSALQQSISGIFFGGVMLLLPFCASVSNATTQIDELQTSVLRWKLLRSSTLRYGFSKILGTTISGGVAISCAFLLHSLIWNIIALPCDPIAHPYHEIIFADDCLYRNWYSTLYGAPMYLSMTFGLFICGAVWANVAQAIAIWVPDRMLSLAIPACIYYLLSANIFQHLFGWKLPHPATLYNDALTLLELKSSLFEYAVIFCIACFIYFIGLKRRAQHA